jgi:heme-degrading monooxygenase HmoA
VGAEATGVTFVSVLELPVRRGSEKELVRLFAQLQIFERSRDSGGFLGGRLLRPLTAGDPFVVVADWESADAYQRWLDNPVRAELGEELEAVLAGDEVAAGRLYEEALG